ncbi:emp24/gp25L/p24 family/GOLD-domain-containing protein, partial [Dipodascopsis tothii]|uniref:emp24/gp25L/p24 family/GOLD-domain-containing protein n=1 Tax=Dipodascopsis tothii TaxID=44089 RepID=UPI0034CD556D
MKLALAVVLALVVARASALYFYLEGSERKCFLEELPKDTLVVGVYNAEEFNPDSNTFRPSAAMGVHITVEEIFDNNHRVVSQRGESSGKFTFTAADPGDHRICLQITGANSGWFSRAAVRVHLDIAVGDAGQIGNKQHNDKIMTLVEKVQELSHRMADIKREQIFQREREAEFRNQSEKINARVVRWTLIQLVVLGATCTWQLSHLRGFFVKQKLV